MTEPVTDAGVLDRLYATAESRRHAEPDASYTARLLHLGTAAIAQKVGEEAVETVIAALQRRVIDGDTASLAAESADLLYHLLVLWADAGLEPSEVWAVLAAREGTSGLAEKRRRPPPP